MHYWVSQVSPILCWRELHRGLDSRSKDHGGYFGGCFFLEMTKLSSREVCPKQYRYICCAFISIILNHYQLYQGLLVLLPPPCTFSSSFPSISLSLSPLFSPFSSSLLTPLHFSPYFPLLPSPLSIFAIGYHSIVLRFVLKLAMSQIVLILLPLLPLKSQDYRHVPLCLVYYFIYVFKTLNSVYLYEDGKDYF